MLHNPAGKYAAKEGAGFMMRGPLELLELTIL